MRRGMLVEVTAILVATGALAGFAAFQFLPRRYVSRTTVAFTGNISSDRYAYAVDRTLSAAVLTPIVLQSAYYKSELDYTPVEELVQRIQNNGSIQRVRIGVRDGFRLEFADPDRYAALAVTQALTEEMERNTGDATQVIEPIRAGLKPPGPGLCVLFGMSGGLLLSLAIAVMLGVSRVRRQRRAVG